jgi:acyl-CoA thioesterase II
VTDVDETHSYHRDCTHDDQSSWIAQLLQYDRHGNIFAAPQTDEPGGRLFGGLIAAQALGAAGATVGSGKQPQSLHAYFVRRGIPGVRVYYCVENIRAGSAFDTLRVTAIQDSRVILEMITSFHTAEPSTDWQPTSGEGLDWNATVPQRKTLRAQRYFDFRTHHDDDAPFVIPPYWVRSRDEIEPTPLIQACALVYLSDIGPVPIARPPGAAVHQGIGASLDHAVWFHRPYLPQRWHRYEVAALNHSNSCGLVTGALYNAECELIATTRQEALWRTRPRADV